MDLLACTSYRRVLLTLTLTYRNAYVFKNRASRRSTSSTPSVNIFGFNYINRMHKGSQVARKYTRTKIDVEDSEADAMRKCSFKALIVVVVVSKSVGKSH